MAWILRRYADRVIAVSESARSHHLTIARLRPERVITVHNGIDLDRFVAPPGTGAAVRVELGVPVDARVLLTVAVLRQAKGIQDMLRALPGVLVAVPDAHYLVVGDGAYRPELQQLTADLGLTDRVTFAGRRTDVDRMLAAAELFVLPSHTDALPTVLAEAMAASLPIVATSVGGIPEMVVPDRSTLLVEPEDTAALAEAAVRLLANPVQAAAMGRTGRRLAETRFDLERQAAELVEEYRFLVGAQAR
jgi:glycosyltransferase involved in cell wall biosynthesis